MKIAIRNAKLFYDRAFVKKDVLIEDGIITDIGSEVSPITGAFVYDMNNCFIFPGLIDVHVHLREPGFFYKETMKSGTMAAAHGGFTTVCAMPNLNPVPDCAEHLTAELEIIKRDAVIRVLPYASITVGEKQRQLSDMEALAERVVAFSDDGVGVESAELMEQAMIRAKILDKMIVAHCEIKELVKGGYIHDGDFARRNGYKGISSESEWREVERDLELVRKTGCPFHVCHVSTQETIELIRRAKAEGLPVSCETAPHYLILCDEDIKDEGRFRMNPPLRSREDRQALVYGIIDGTIDMIATDHAPHSAEEKSRGLQNSMNGIVGLETAFPVLYTKLVKTGVITLEKLMELMHISPSRRFGIGNELEIGAPADLTVFDLNEEYVINPDNFLSKGHATPFAGEKVFGKCLLTLCGGRVAWEDPIKTEV
ncbi:MAG: dihydroorotase [Oscillospiraceae bacterium]|nr:dihydroorotase [Oscillospiraceae bacterium]